MGASGWNFSSPTAGAHAPGSQSCQHEQDAHKDPMAPSDPTNAPGRSHMWCPLIACMRGLQRDAGRLLIELGDASQIVLRWNLEKKVSKGVEGGRIAS